MQESIIHHLISFTFLSNQPVLTTWGLHSSLCFMLAARGQTILDLA